jgi:hypothetical protein
MPGFSQKIALMAPSGVVSLYVLPKESINAQAGSLKLPVGTCGYTQIGKDGKAFSIVVPPLNTAEDLECWRHELRHALEGRWHP